MCVSACAARGSHLRMRRSSGARTGAAVDNRQMGAAAGAIDGTAVLARRAGTRAARAAIGPCGAIIAAAAITWLLLPSLAGREILAYRDMLHNYAPLKALFWNWPPPLWNDHAFSGSSALADLNQQPFYLPNLLFALARAPIWPGIAIYLWLHVLFGIWATHALCRRVAPDTAGVGAAAFALCGFSIANFSNPQWACAATWAPAVLLAFIVWGEEGGIGPAALVALSLPQVLLAGDPPLFVLLAASGAAVAFSRRNRPASRLVLEGAAIALAAAVLVLPQLAATLRAFPSLRRAAGLPRDVREQWSLHPARISELFVPRLFGPLFDVKRFWGGFTVSPPWKRNYVHSIYAGLVGPGLVVLAAARRSRIARPWVLLALAALALALGRYFFHAYGVVGELVPGFRAFRYPQRMVALFMPAWAVLVAVGASELPRLERRARVALVCASAALSVVALAVTAASFPADFASVSRSGVQIAVIALAAAIAMLLPRGAIGPAIAIVLAVDLLAANGETLGSLPRSLFAHEPAACTAIDRASHGADRKSFRVYVEQAGLEATGTEWAPRRSHEFEVGRRNVLEQCGFRQSISLTSLDPLAETDLWAAVGPVRVLRALSTRYAVSVPGLSSALGAREVVRDDRWGFVVSELSDVSPVVFRPERVVTIASAELPAAAAKDPALLGPTVAALETAPREHVADPGARLFSLQHDASWRSFSVVQERPGYWVSASTFDDDWRATVDGAPARIEHADRIRRAIWVPAGRHTIELEYRPVLLLALFGIALLLSCGLAIAACGWLRKNLLRPPV
jgi:hypothetical protein